MVAIPTLARIGLIAFRVATATGYPVRYSLKGSGLPKWMQNAIAKGFEWGTYGGIIANFIKFEEEGGNVTNGVSQEIQQRPNNRQHKARSSLQYSSRYGRKRKSGKYCYSQKRPRR